MGVVWEGLWRRRAETGSWRMGEEREGLGRRSREHRVSKESEGAPAADLNWERCAGSRVEF